MSRSFSPHSTNLQRGRGVTAVLGPTNTGKTHLAIERMLAHDVGIIGLPLRLLAREVYDKIVARVGAAKVALITGEEKIKPPSPRFYVCTVEAMPLDLEADFVAVDEVQLAADGERGHVFTDRLFHARGLNETLLLGAATMRDAIREILPGANLVSRPRLSQLSYAGDKKITRLPRRSAIVGFSANDVYAIAELVRRQRGGAAVVLGALSPRTRNAQVALYQNGDVDFLVATDAIGMGLNLDLDHVAFAGIRKFDGQSHRNLTPAELGQIAGRAGRHMNDGTFGVTGQVAAVRAGADRPAGEPFLRSGRRPAMAEPQARFQLDRAAEGQLARDAGPSAACPLAHGRRRDRARKCEPRPGRARHGGRAGRGRSAVGDVPDPRLPEDLGGKPRRAGRHALSLRHERYTARFPPIGSPTRWRSPTAATAISTRCRTGWRRSAPGPSSRITPNGSTIRSIGRAARGRSRTRLSDALHERLTQRFVDRRTSVLMRRLRDKEEIAAEIGADGKILVENHYVGRLDGFRFTPDASSDGIHGRATRHAAAQVLAGELADRADALAAAPDEAIALTANGRIVWSGSEIARIEKGETALKPQHRAFRRRASRRPQTASGC